MTILYAFYSVEEVTVAAATALVIIFTIWGLVALFKSLFNLFRKKEPEKKYNLTFKESVMLEQLRKKSRKSRASRW